MKHLPLHFIGFALVAFGAAAQAAECREGFDNAATLPQRGWLKKNNSDPLGTTGWFQGNPNLFSAHSGAANSYVSADLDGASATGYPVLSNWLITPEIAFGPGVSFGFYTRAFGGAGDRVVVRLCVRSGSVTCAAPGPMSGDAGGFQTYLADINPEQTTTGYPTAWTAYQLTTMDGLPASGRGRIAFHYYGFWQSDVAIGSTIGFDDVTLTGTGGCPLTDIVFADGFD